MTNFLQHLQSLMGVKFISRRLPTCKCSHLPGATTVASTPNGSICYISPVYVGSISDVDLTRHSGFLQTLADKPGVSIMSDRGFTVKEMLKELPPFLQGRQQLPREEVQKGRKIASLRIHVERAIGRIKTFSILKQTIPISMARLTNEIVSGSIIIWG